MRSTCNYFSTRFGNPRAAEDASLIDHETFHFLNNVKLQELAEPFYGFYTLCIMSVNVN
jgi:hypothetical protein